MLCKYGCSQEATYKDRCDKAWSKCPELIRKNSESLKKAYSEGRKKGWDITREQRAWNKGKILPSRKRLIETVLIENSPYSTAIAKQVILKNKLLDYVCAKCNIIEWFGKKLKLHLHHKNGINKDHRIENIDFLCPNCHDIATPIWKKKDSPGLHAEI